MEDLEKRSVQAREESQFKKLRSILENSKNNSTGWKTILKNINVEEITNKNSLSKIPITRKSLLSNINLRKSVNIYSNIALVGRVIIIGPSYPNISV